MKYSLKYKKTFLFYFIENEPKLSPFTPSDDILKSVLNLPTVRNCLAVCDMFRIHFADYCVVWYNNGRKARLTISQSILS